MRYCFKCKYLSPQDAIYCAHCGCSFGGRRCSNQHLSPPDARICIQCGTSELTDATSSISITKVAQVATLVLLGIMAAAMAPSLLQQFARSTSAGGQAAINAFNVALLDRILGFLLGPTIILFLIPGEIGRSIRRNVAQGLGRLIREFFYFLALLPRLLVSLLLSLSRRR